MKSVSGTALEVARSAFTWLFLRPFSWRDPKGWPVVTGPCDRVLFRLVVALLVFGVVMVYSASYVRAISQLLGGQHYVVRQGIFATLGILVIYGLERVDYHHYRVHAMPLLLSTLASLAAVVWGFGHRSGGSTRWIALGPIHVQPAEVAKLTLVIWLSASLTHKTQRIHDFSVGVLPHVVVASAIASLCMMQPDFGSSVTMMIYTLMLLYLAGARPRHLLALCGGALAIASLLVGLSEYRSERVISWTTGLTAAGTQPSYQVTQSLLSFQAGGWTGVGLGQSHQKRLYLPECHTDFIAAIIAEELGLAGFVVMLLVFACIIQRGLRAALRAQDTFGLYLGTALSLALGIAILMNLAVVLGALPPKGLTLPLVSFGGSSLLATCAAVGILLNISRPRRSRDDLTLPADGDSSPEDSRGEPPTTASCSEVDDRSVT